MLTIKHAQTDGYEQIYADVPDLSANKKCIAFRSRATGEQYVFDTGTIYVMNESGKTIQRYEF